MDQKIQWHPAFYSAVELTLMKDANVLHYTRELNLTYKPLQADLFVLYLDDHKPIENEIGRYFKKYNLFEYKSPSAALSIDHYYKTVGYCCQFKAVNSDSVNSVKAEDITMILIRHSRPIGMFKDLALEGVQIKKCCPGIYRLSGRVLFTTLVIVTKELPKKDSIWLTSLVRKLGKDQARQLLEAIDELPQRPKEQRLADSVMQVVVSANYELFEKLKKEEPNMCEALRRLMAPEIEEELKKRTAQIIEQGIEQGMKQGMEKGIEKGKRQGIVKEKYDAARRMMLKNKYGNEEIADITGLTIHEVKKIKKAIALIN